MYLSKRNGIYQLYYKKDTGKITSISTKTGLKKEALEFLSEFESKLKERKKLKYIPKSLKEYANEYLEYSESVHRPKTTMQLETIFKSLQAFTGDVQLNSLTPKDLQDYLILKSKVSAYTAQKHLAYLKCAFRRAQENGYMLENPCQKIKAFRLPEKQPLFFSQTDFKELLGVIDDKDIKDIVRFAVNVGCRQMELLTLQWRQVDFEKELMVLDNRNGFLTKSKKVRAVPLNAEAMGILKERKKVMTGEYVFTYCGEPMNQDFISKKFKKYVKKCDINPALNFHSLRHTTASWLVQKGVSIYEVKELLGHADIKTSTIYSHINIGELRASVAKLNSGGNTYQEWPDFVI